MTVLWGVATAILAMLAVVLLVILGRPLHLLAEIWWILFLAYLAGMVAAWYGHVRRPGAERPDPGAN